MITERTLARLTPRVEDLCPHLWFNHRKFTPCRASSGAQRADVHSCVGDVGHRGKHVCRCGALRSTLLD